MKTRRLYTGLGMALLVIALAGIAFATTQRQLFARGNSSDARAVLSSASGQPVGQVKFSEDDGHINVKADVHSLPPGFHGFHVHSVGQCAPDFTAAGGHLNPTGDGHPHHAADMPVLLVNADGEAKASFSTDRYTIDSLFDGDGSAIIIHALPDNYANIPERYGVADEATLSTGDAGGRIACGVIEQGRGKGDKKKTGREED